MLFKQIHLEGIKTGKISLAFRKWKKLSVTKGGLIKTSVGQIEIEDIKIVDKNEVTPGDAAKAGFDQLEDLLKILNSVAEGEIYKITIRYHSADPRIRLREQVSLNDEEFKQLKSKLERLDRYSKQGSWTLTILKAIRENPRLKAGDLATKTGREKEWLKLNIRKLKNLGLTISHEPGYTLSSLGTIFLDRLLMNKI